MVGDCRMLGCLHSVFNQVEINGFARRWIMVQRSVLGMKLECQAIIRNCDSELFTRYLQKRSDSKSWNGDKIIWESFVENLWKMCTLFVSLSETDAYYVWNSFPLSLSIIPYHSKFFSLSRNFHLDYNSQWLWLFCMLLKLFISFQILSEKKVVKCFY